MDLRKRNFPVIGVKYIGNRKVWAVIGPERAVLNLEYHPAFEKLFPKGSDFPCVIDKGRIGAKYEINWYEIYSHFYKEDCEYQFEVVSVEEDPTNFSKHLVLKDEYGFEFFLLNPSKNDASSVGRSITCLVKEVSYLGLVLFSTSKAADNKNTESQRQYDDELFDRLKKSREDTFREFNKRSFRGVWKSVIDKYPDTAHFIYELLQNADDAQATHVTILLGNNALIFKHNGSVHFSVSDDDDEDAPLGHINSITGIGDSTKGDDAHTNRIGKFGIGFKSVFQYTDAPEIYDDYFRFRIKNYIIPERLEHDHEERDEGETLFYIPFKNPKAAFNEIGSKLKVLANVTLFLHNLTMIKWRNLATGETKSFSKSITSSFTSSRNILLERITLTDYRGDKKLLMFSRLVNVKGEGKHRIYVGYYLRGNGEIDTDIRPKVHCFFPTSESFDMCMIMHAPFLLVDNRQQIKPFEKTNETLVNELGRLSSDTLCELKELGQREGNTLLNENIFGIVQWDEYDSWWEYRLRQIDDSLICQMAIIKPCVQKIKNDELLLSSDNRYLKACDIYQISPDSLASLINAKQLQVLRNSKKEIGILSPKLNDLDFDEISEVVGLKSYFTQQFASDITPVFMASQPSAWVNRLFAFLNNDVRKTWLPEEKNPYFLKAPIIETVNGDWVTPFADGHINVFTDGDSSEYNVVSKVMMGSHQVKKFLKDIGCKEPDQLDYINTHVFSKYESGEDINETDLIEDFGLIYKYYHNNATLDSRKQLLEKARKSLQLACLDLNGDSYINHPYEIYWDSNELKTYYEGSNDDIQFIDRRFYARFIKEYGGDAFFEFVKELGIMTLPQVEIKKEHNPYSLTDMQKEQLDFNNTPKTYWSIEEPIVNGLEFAFDNIGKKRSHAIWTILSQIEVSNIIHSEFSYQYYQPYHKTCDSRAYELLKTTPWLYVGNKAVLPSSVSKDKIIESGYEPAPELNELLGIRKAEISLKELGATDEQQSAYEIGAYAQKNGYSLAAVEKLIKQDLDKKKEEKKKQKAAVFDDTILNNNRDALPSCGKEVFKNAPIIEQTTSPAAAIDERRSEERKEKLQQKRDKALAEIERNEEFESLRERVLQLPKYSKEWFEGLLELEYRYDAATQSDSSNTKSISISFGCVVKDVLSNRIYILKQPSGRIPLSLEELDRIEVRFQFTDREDMTISFEVGSVRDFTLRLKAKAKDEPTLSKIDWKNTCTRAVVSTNNVTELMSKLITSFHEFGYEDGFDFKANLKDNVSFVFGPPGTGKTTHISETICRIMEKEQYCKILVLAPTNQACDVVTERIAKTTKASGWLGRFVATGSDWIEKEGLLLTRDSEIYEQDQCCVVSTMARLPYDGFQGTGRSMALREIDWNYVIIDEASMIPLAQVVYAIFQFSPYAKIIIAGDPMQIPPIVKEKIWENENIYSMVNLNRFDNPKTQPIQFDITNLTTQYRSIPAIGKVFSKYRYGGLLKHYRPQSDQRKIAIKGLGFKSINFISFKVERYDSIFGPKKLADSNVQVYSVLFITELSKYIAKEYSDKKPLRIGIICPYRAEAQMIERLIEQMKDAPKNLSFDVGTIHGFQGDECDMVFAVFNPPTAMKTHPSQIMLNEKHILNVAISRARDYLFLLIPHPNTDGFENLTEIRRLGSIIYGENSLDEIASFTCDEIEKVMFGEQFYLENHSFITTHQMANVYTDPQAKYEVRIDENAVDIQVSE